MNARSNSFRLQHWQFAERQRYLSDLESLGARVRADFEALREEIDHAGGADAAPVKARIDPLFMRPLLERHDRLLRSIAEIDTQIVEARAALAAAEQDVKLIEGTMVHRGLKFEERLTRRARRSV
jgi:hypothetical protein